MGIDLGEYTQPPEIKNNNIEIKVGSVASIIHSARNEDSFFVEKKSFGVFDGVGGNVGGDEASKLARDEVNESFKKLPQNPELQDVKDIIFESLAIANKTVNRLSIQRDNNMGTTACIGVIWEGLQGEKKAVIGNIGDSRAYILRNGILEQITVDDNDVRVFFKTEKEVRKVQSELSNTLNPQELTDENKRFLFKNRHTISQHIGQDNGIAPKIYTVDLLPDDKLFLCSDGISDNLTNSEIESLLNSNPDSDFAIQKIIEASQQRSRSGHPRSKMDDMTALIVNMNPSVSSGTIILENNQQFEKPKFDSNSKNLKVERSGGRIDSGWTIVSFDEETQIATLSKKEDGQTKIKTAPMSALEELNKPSKIEGLDTVQNPRELFDLLDEIGGVQGLTKEYNSSEIGILITDVLRNKQPISALDDVEDIKELISKWKSNS